MNPASDDPLELAYLAGIIDGEGCIGLYRYTKQYVCSVAIGMCDAEPILLLHGLYGGHYRVEKKCRKRPVHCLSMQGIAAQRCLTDLIPFLRVKQGRAEIALKFLRIGTKRYGRAGTPAAVKEAKDDLVNQMRELVEMEQ